MSDKTYYCQNCGGVMVFDVNTQSLKCPNCETQVDIKNDQRKIVEHSYTKNAIKKIPVQEKKSSTMQCTGCGAVVEVSEDCTAIECAYCGTKYVLAEKQLDAIIPDGLVPFKVDKYKVKEVFTNWINKRWLAPGALKNLYESDKIQGMYIPYWTFDAEADCPYKAEGGKHRKVKEKKSDGSEVEKTVTDWEPTSGRVRESFDDIQVKATKNMKASLLKGIEPYDTKHQIVSYSPEYLSGYSSECYSIPIEDAHKDAVRIMESELRSKASQDVRRRYDEVRNVSINPTYFDETYKHVLIPVYATSYNYSGKTYNVLINGETGKIKGDYPKSKVKIAIIVAIIIAILVAIFAFGKKGNNNSSSDSASVVPSYSQNMICESYDEEVIDVDYVEIVVDEKI